MQFGFTYFAFLEKWNRKRYFDNFAQLTLEYIFRTFRLFRIEPYFKVNFVLSFITYISIYIKESRVCPSTYNSRTAEPIWLKIGGEVT